MASDRRALRAMERVSVPDASRWAHASCLVEQKITGVVALAHTNSAVLKHENLLTNDCNIGILPVDYS